MSETDSSFASPSIWKHRVLGFYCNGILLWIRCSYRNITEQKESTRHKNNVDLVLVRGWKAINFLFKVRNGLRLDRKSLNNGNFLNFSSVCMIALANVFFIQNFREDHECKNHTYHSKKSFDESILQELIFPETDFLIKHTCSCM